MTQKNIRETDFSFFSLKFFLDDGMFFRLDRILEGLILLDQRYRQPYIDLYTYLVIGLQRGVNCGNRGLVCQS
jgi:hypothetical protein